MPFGTVPPWQSGVWIMTYEEALRYYAQIDMMGSHLGLDRMAELLRRL